MNGGGVGTMGLFDPGQQLLFTHENPIPDMREREMIERKEIVTVYQ